MVENRYFISCDFETVLIKNNHYVYMWSIFVPQILTYKIKNLDFYLDFSENNILLNEKKLLNSFFSSLRLLKDKIPSKKKIIYMHNFGNFDGIFLFRHLLNGKISGECLVNIVVRNSTIYELTTNNFTFRDSYKLLPISLERMIKIYFHGNKEKFDFVLSDPDSIKLNIKKIKKYCFKDSMYLWFCMYKFSDIIFHMVEFSIHEASSLSGLSFKIFKSKYRNSFNKISNSAQYNSSIYNIIASSYRGGIVDVYNPYCKDGFYLDINSSYPFSMKNYMPVGNPIKISYDKYNFHLKNNFINFFGFIRCKIEVDYDYIPFLGIRSKESSSIIYPYGIFTISVFSEELKYAIKVNKIKILKIYDMVEYKKEKIFTNFVNDLYKYRYNSGLAYKHSVKILLNSLYGRMGLKKSIDKFILIDKSDLPYYNMIFSVKIFFIDDNSKSAYIKVSNKNSKSIRELLDDSLYPPELKKKLYKIYNFVKRKERYIFNAVHIASAVTAYSRILIDKIKRKILKHGGILHYSDTDSVIFSNLSYKIFGVNLELGGLKIESKVKEGVFLSPKSYIIHDGNKEIIKLKGFPQSELKNSKFDLELFKSYLYKKNIDKVIYYRWLSYVSKNINKFKIEKKEKLYSTNFYYNKRIKLYKNNLWFNTTPINLNNFDKNFYIIFLKNWIKNWIKKWIKK